MLELLHTRCQSFKQKKIHPVLRGWIWVWISSDKLAHCFVEPPHGNLRRQQVLHGSNIILHLLRF